ncbi:MAG TPA: hypothetical protein PKE69_15880 [Pyrinomonadaceae bacterium]|nr:hypothetical protein [Pyrinomonadaceae bacterium]
MPIDDEIAREVVKKAIRHAGGLPSDIPIFAQHKLSTLRILTSQHLESFRVAIMDKLDDQGLKIAKAFLNPMTTSTKVFQAVAIVSENAGLPAEEVTL